jgi:O-antigen/teichoic acid export membrane protein
VVTPLAQAVALRDRQREAELLRTTFMPLVVIAAAGLAIGFPLLSALPLRTLFGLAATVESGSALRVAALLACVGTVAAVPLSAVESVRQAYQELHVNNVLNTLCNALLCVGLLVTSWLKPTLPAFVAVIVFVPLALRFINAALLFHQRPYLLALRPRVRWSQAASLIRDGLSYMGAAAIAGVLVYQWPVYYMGRVRPPIETSQFAVYTQLLLLTLSLSTNLSLPLWGAIADACARRDYRWVTTLVRRARLGALAYGFSGMVVFGLGSNFILRIWLHKTFPVSGRLSWLAGIYVLLATWETVHWPMALGLGAIRPASAALFWRTVGFAVSVPFVISYGATGLIAALCVSIAAATLWFYPLLLDRTSSRFQPAEARA